MSAQKSQKVIEIEAHKPGTALTKFVDKNFKYAMNGKSKSSRQIPKLTFIQKKAMDKKVVESGRDKKLRELREQYSSIPKDKTEERIKIRDEFERLKNDTRAYYQDIIDLDNLSFLKELREAISKSSEIQPLESLIFDPELRGLLNICESKVKIGDKEVKVVKDQEMMKKVIQNCVDFVATNDEFSTIKDTFNKIVTDIDMWKTKIFNIVFEHPVLKETKDGRQLKLYLLKSYAHLSEVLKCVIDGDDEKDVAKKIARSLKISSARQDLIIANYASESTEWVKNLDKDEKKVVRDALSKVVSAVSCYKFISKMDKKNLKDNYSKFVEMSEKIEKLPTLAKDDNVKEFVKKIVSVMVALRKIDVRDDKKKDKDGQEIDAEKLDTIFFTLLNKATPLMMSKTLKKRLLKCVYEDVVPEIVDEEMKNEEMKPMQFKISEFEGISDPTTELYDVKKYAKFGSIVDAKLPKQQRVAIGIRTVSEIVREIQRLQLEHGSNKFSVQLTC